MIREGNEKFFWQKEKIAIFTNIVYGTEKNSNNNNNDERNVVKLKNRESYSSKKWKKEEKPRKMKRLITFFCKTINKSNVYSVLSPFKYWTFPQ